MNFDPTLLLLIPATVLTGLLAGISLDKAIVQLPARHRLGITGFAAFSRANDLGKGLVLYPLLGVGAALLTTLTGIFAWVEKIPFHQAWPLYAGVLLALLHSIATSRAAPNMLRLRQSSFSEEELSAFLDRFAAWHTLRTVLQCLNFVVLVWALLTLALFLNRPFL